MTLEQELVNEMLHLYKTAKIKCNYNTTRFIQMFYDKEAWQTAAALINSNTPTDSFAAMWECN